ncbi:MAG: T9SS type A sorting domain-containing protein [Chitinophagaceae bacterium]
MVYPNPIKNKTFTLQLFNIKAAEYKLQLFNSVGQEVYFQNLSLPLTSYISQNIDLKNASLPFGSYQLLLTNNLGYKQTERILIEH